MAGQRAQNKMQQDSKSKMRATSKDEEAAGVSRTVSQEVPPPSGLSPAMRRALWVAVAVLVAAASTAIIVGVVGGIVSPKSGSSSSSDGGTTGVPAPAAPSPAPAPATPAGSSSPPVTQAALPPPAALPAPPPPVANFTGQQPPFLVPNGFMAVWWDEFESLDTGRWLLQTGAPEQQLQGVQQFTANPANLAVADGNLTITALKEGAGYTSARLNSKPSGSWYPGMQLPDGSKVKSVHVAARIRVPAGGSGLLASLSMQPVDPKYGNWPSSGQIDIMAAANDMKRVSQAIQYGEPYPDNEESAVPTELPDGVPFSNDFHLFALDWQKDDMKLKIDGDETGSFNSWWTPAEGATNPAPFDQPFSLVLDLSVGARGADAAGPTTPASASMMVDYVRVMVKLRKGEDDGGDNEN